MRLSRLLPVFCICAFSCFAGQKLVYVATTSEATKDGLVSVYKAETLEHVTDIPVGTYPSIISDHSGTKIYVVSLAVPPNNGLGFVPFSYVTEIDTATQTVTAEFPCGGYQDTLAISKDDKTLYVAIRPGNQVEVYDTKTRNLKAVVIVGSGPMALASSQDGKMLYSANISDSTLSVIDAQKLTVLQTYSLPGSPTSAQLSQDGKTLFLSVFNNWGNPYFDAYEVTLDVATGNFMIGWDMGAVFGHVALSPNGDTLYYNSPTSVAAHATRNSGTNSGSPQLPESPADLAVSNDGKMVATTIRGTAPGLMVMRTGTLEVVGSVSLPGVTPSGVVFVDVN